MARLIAGTQSQHIIGDIKHYAFNDQESGRGSADVHIGERAARESDLLAFEIGVEQGHPDAVMCAYNRVNGVFSCESNYLLNEVLKKGLGDSLDWCSRTAAVRTVLKSFCGRTRSRGGWIDFYGDR